MKILVTANQKGGVGKSTLTAHLAYAAHEDGKRVLMHSVTMPIFLRNAMIMR